VLDVASAYCACLPYSWRTSGSHGSAVTSQMLRRTNTSSITLRVSDRRLPGYYIGDRPEVPDIQWRSC
jgi:hypothetical protein